MNELADLTQKALALSEADRIVLAQNLWESIEGDLPEVTTEELHRRLGEEPDANWRSHDEILAEAQREFGCRK
ncbi:MAG: hypothetical protein EXS31_07605 [Pedosphaera sp.]|nr:hypothetical protein [Pedosphaera sp.]